MFVILSFIEIMNLPAQNSGPTQSKACSHYALKTQKLGIVVTFNMFSITERDIILCIELPFVVNWNTFSLVDNFFL